MSIEEEGNILIFDNIIEILIDIEVIFFRFILYVYMKKIFYQFLKWTARQYVRRHTPYVIGIT